MPTCGWQSALTRPVVDWRGGVVCSGESALGAAEEATAEADNQAPHSEPMEALVAEGKATLGQARAVQVERVRAAAEEASERRISQQLRHVLGDVTGEGAL